MLRYLLLPWRPAPLILIATFTLGLVIAVYAGLTGVLLAVLLVSWFFKYCFALLDAAIAGDEPPVLSVEMVNPLDEQRPLAQAIIIAAGCVLAGYVGSKAGRPALVLTAALLLASLPASVAALGLSGNPFHAASPMAIYRLVRGIGRDYAGLVLATLLFGAALYGLIGLDAPLPVTIALGQLAFLSMFALIGGAVHENRFALGVPTRTRAERMAERDQREHIAERKRVLDRSFTHQRLGRGADAWAEIERWIALHCPNSSEHHPRAHAEYPALIDSASTWSDPRIADRLTNDYLARLLVQRENGKALEALERRLASNPAFRPAPQMHARLAELAGLAGKRSLQRALAREEGVAKDV